MLQKKDKYFFSSSAPLHISFGIFIVSNNILVTIYLLASDIYNNTVELHKSFCWLHVKGYFRYHVVFVIWKSFESFIKSSHCSVFHLSVLKHLDKLNISSSV